MKKSVDPRFLTPLIFVGLLGGGLGLKSIASAVVLHASPKQSDPKERANEISKAFLPFSPVVKTRSDSKNFYVESKGLPAHNMMVGITNWQQQVPIAQNYTGANAWQFPLFPTPAANPMSAKDHFFRGALVIAANGIPVFNALNNRGEDSNAIGELDEWGGHCGRADDYHYHIAPTHLTKTGGIDKPIGYALDGYPLFSYTEPDGSEPGKLDAFNGHTTTKLGYHYHATKTYPYLNGGFHGEVREVGGQVDPQPRAEGIRRDGQPLRGAKITGFEKPKAGSYSLSFTWDSKSYKINYSLQSDGGYKFDFVSPDGSVNSESYSRRGGQGGPTEGNRSPQGERPPRPGGSGPNPFDDGGAGGSGANRLPVAEEPIVQIAPTKGFVLSSPSVGKDGVLPVEFTGDGSASTLPLSWVGAPAGTKSFALVMHHLDPQGVTKCYWILYNIPAGTTNLPKNVSGIGNLGVNTVNDRVGYAPPHSQGPGKKVYVLTLYALNDVLDLAKLGTRVRREKLMQEIKSKVLAFSDLSVNYTRF